MSETDIVARLDELRGSASTEEIRQLRVTFAALRSDLSRMREALDDARKWVIIARTYAVHREEATKALAKIDAALSPAEKGEA